MFAPILKMEGTWHVLSKLDHLILRISNRKKHVAGTRLLRLRRLDVPCDVVLLQGFNIAGFITDMHESQGLGLVFLLVEFDKLTIVDLDIRNRWLTRIVEVKLLFYLELF